MLFRPPILLMAINLVGTVAFSPVLVNPVKVTETSTTLFNKKKKATKKKKGDRSTPKGFAGALRDLQKNAFPYSGGIRPGKQSPQKVVLDESIMKPDYAIDGQVRF